MFTALVPSPGGFLGVGVFRRSLMVAPKFRRILARHGVALSARAIVRADAIFRAHPRNVAHAQRLAKSLGLKPGMLSLRAGDRAAGKGDKGSV